MIWGLRKQRKNGLRKEKIASGIIRVDGKKELLYLKRKHRNISWGVTYWIAVDNKSNFDRKY